MSWRQILSVSCGKCILFCWLIYFQMSQNFLDKKNYSKTQTQKDLFDKLECLSRFQNCTLISCLRKRQELNQAKTFKVSHFKCELKVWLKFKKPSLTRRRCSLLGRFLALPAKIRLWIKCLAEESTFRLQDRLLASPTTISIGWKYLLGAPRYDRHDQQILFLGESVTSFRCSHIG
jgi:hypothetical protein